MGNTTAKEVFDSFESSFADKHVLADELEKIWLLKAIAKYSVELSPLAFDAETMMFDSDIGQYVIDTLASFMKLFYQEREVSRVNKRVSIVGKDISIDGNNGSKTAAANELNYVKEESKTMVGNQKTTAYK